MEAVTQSRARLVKSPAAGSESADIRLTSGPDHERSANNILQALSEYGYCSAMSPSALTRADRQARMWDA